MFKSEAIRNQGRFNASCGFEAFESDIVDSGNIAITGRDETEQAESHPVPSNTCFRIHGVDDPTVPVDAVDVIASNARDGRAVRIDGGDHVFNTKNPMPAGSAPSVQLARLVEVATDAARTVLG